mmetsp:Transcript_6573/g.4730  ORF Transcript_6573/g.4730 Transcript_6573/m.4730 type:complete len:107 (+) Transcript_6573:20-340(+)
MDLDFSVTYEVPAYVIYKAFVDQGMMSHWTQGQVVSEPQNGGKLSLFNGTIIGEYAEVEENKKLVMKWKFKDWADFADCVITFSEDGSTTDINVSYKNIPEYDIYS